MKMFKLYSVQVITFVASLNTVIAFVPGVPAWAVGVVNLAGVLAHQIARKAPQPKVVSELRANGLMK